MQTLKDHFNYKARQQYIDLIVLLDTVASAHCQISATAKRHRLPSPENPSIFPAPLTRVAAPVNRGRRTIKDLPYLNWLLV